MPFSSYATVDFSSEIVASSSCALRRSFTNSLSSIAFTAAAGVEMLEIPRNTSGRAKTGVQI